MDPADLYPRDVIDDLAAAIELGPVILVGVPGSARAAVAHAAVRRLDRGEPLVIDPARAGTLAALAADVARELVSIVLDTPDPPLGGLSPAQLRALQRFAGPDAHGLLATAQGDHGVGLDTLLGLVDSRTPIVVRDAVQLTHRWARDALWTLRGRATDDDAPRVVLIARPHHTLADTGDAFLGAATTFRLRPPSAPTLFGRLAEQGSVEDPGANWITASRGLPAVITTAHKLGGGDGDAGWTAMIAATVGQRDAIQRLALEAHQLGPRLIEAIAQRQPPYGSVPGAAPALISKALAALRDVDLIIQPAARQWQIADPALEVVLSAPELAGWVPIRVPS